MLKKASKSQEDPYIALLAYRSTPTADGLPSPAERLFGRKIRNRLPSFRPIISDKSIMSKLYQNKIKQKLYYDKNAKDLSMLTPGATVRIRQGDKKEWSTKCKVISDAKFPRSYIVQIPQGKHLRRIRKDLLETSENFELKLAVTMTHQQQFQFLKMRSWPFQHHSKELKNIMSQGLDV